MPTRLTPDAIAVLRQQHPELRDDYFDYLSCIGWGETESGRMIFKGPTGPEDIYGPRADLCGILLLGDDFQGYCFGYHTQMKCYGEVSNAGAWEPWPKSEGFLRYVTDLDDKGT